MPLVFTICSVTFGSGWGIVTTIAARGPKLIALSIVRHKELRYLQVMIPSLAIAGGIGFAAMVQRSRKWALSLLLISLIWDLHGLRYFARKSMPNVDAARVLASDPRVNTVAVQQV